MGASGAVLSSPRAFFDGLPERPEAGRATRYLLACLFAATAASLLAVLALLAVPVLAALLAARAAGLPNGGPLFPPVEGLTRLLPVLPLALVAVPLALAALALLWAALLHLLVALLARRNGGARPFGKTWAVTCYSWGTAALFAWLPLVGLLAIPYGLWLNAVGLASVHGVSLRRALPAVASLGVCASAISLTALALAASAGYARAAEGGYLPWELEVSEGLPEGAYDLDALQVDHQGSERLREIRRAAYDTEVPEARLGVQILVVSSAPEGAPRGVVGRAESSAGGSVRVGRGDQLRREEADGVVYGTSRTTFRAPVHAGEKEVPHETLCQIFYFPEVGGAAVGEGRDATGTVELEQVGGEDQWRAVLVRAYSKDLEEEEAVASWLVPYQLYMRPGEEMRLRIASGQPFDDLVLEADRDADGRYEERWRPESDVVGRGADDRRAPTVQAGVRTGPNGGRLVALEAEDGPQGAPNAGVGIVYYYLNGVGPAVYTEPFPVERDDFVTYSAIDRAGNASPWRVDGVRDLPARGGER